MTARRGIGVGAREPQTLVDALEGAAAEAPQATAFIFLTHAGERRIDYAGLSARARAVAAALQCTAAAGDRVAIAAPPGESFVTGFLGCIYAGVVAVPLQPPGRRTAGRVRSILSDAQPAAVVTGGAPLEAPEYESSAAWGPRIVDVDACQDASGWRRRPLSSGDLALLQYTSGSTGTPRGVMVTHGNLFHNHLMIHETFGLTASSVIVGWLPPYHDMGLVGHVVEPIYSRVPTVLMPPLAFAKSPLAWLRAIATYRATVSGGPNAAYQSCVDRIPDRDLEGLDLRCWSVAFNGSEPVRDATMAAFATRFAPCGFDRRAFVPCYGLAEATLLVAARRQAADGSEAAAPTRRTPRNDVSCGRPAPGVSVAIVDPSTNEPRPPGAIGEIWLAGPNVSPGYWNQPAATEAASGRLAGERYVRSGDLGFVADGELFVTGRLKDLIILGGINHYPEDIELTAQTAHAALSGCAGAAFDVSVGSEARVALVQEVQEEAATQDVLSEILAHLGAVHELVLSAVLLVRRGTLPRTPTGKVQRHACRQQFLDGTLAVIAERRSAMACAADGPLTACETDTERQLVAICTEVLAAAAIGRDTNLLQVGGNSLAVTRIVNRLRERFAIVVPVRLLFEAQTVRAIAAEVDRLMACPPPDTHPLPPLVTCRRGDEGTAARR